MQNSQIFPGLCPWTLVRAYSAPPPDSPTEQRFFYSLRLLKNRHPRKIAGTGFTKYLILQNNFLCVMYCKNCEWKRGSRKSYFLESNSEIIYISYLYFLMLRNMKALFKGNFLSLYFLLLLPNFVVPQDH